MDEFHRWKYDAQLQEGSVEMFRYVISVQVRSAHHGQEDKEARDTPNISDDHSDEK